MRRVLVMNNQEALDTLAPCKEDGYECIACKDIDTCKERQAYKILQELIDICSKPNSIKLKLDHIQDVIQCSYETDSKGKILENRWNSDLEDAEEYLQDIKQAYSFRVEDTRIVNELQEMLGCNVDSIVARVNQLEKALDKACQDCEVYDECLAQEFATNRITIESWETRKKKYLEESEK